MIVSVIYRFLRLNSQTLALVEIHPNNPIPQPTTCVYPESPYLTPQRLETEKKIVGSDSRHCKIFLGWNFDIAVEQAEESPVIDYQDKIGKEREVILWNYLDPLEDIYWDEYAPLFDNNLDLILRES